jgi:hypothetical protein
LLACRLEPSGSAQWEGMWQLERLHQALEKYSQGLAPEDREANRACGGLKCARYLSLMVNRHLR